MQSLKSIIESKRVKTMWLDDYNLLVYTKKENDIIVSLFYVKKYGTIVEIHEQYLKTLTNEEYLSKGCIKISEDNRLIAFIDKDNNNLYLDKIYSIDNHNYLSDDENDIEFENKFLDKNIQFIRKLEV